MNNDVMPPGSAKKLENMTTALTRLASMEAFVVWTAGTDQPADKELIARIEYAEATLADNQ